MSPSKSGQTRQARRRNVSDLTEEQKQRKRIVDRQAQQAFRERTKARIEELEGEVSRLQQNTARSKEELAAENARLTEQIHGLSSRLQQIWHLSSGLETLGEDRGESSPSPSVHVHDQADVVGSLDAAFCGPEGQSSVYSTNVEHNTSSPTPPEPQVAQVALSGSEATPAATADDTEDTSLSHITTYHSTQGLSLWTPESPQRLRKQRRVHDVPCDHSSPTCPFDSILLNLLDSRRSLLAHGWSNESVIGPVQPDIAGMFKPEKTAASHPLSRVIVEMMHTFKHVGLVERVGFMYKIHKTMRWHIAPGQDTYEVLPVWLRPTAKQITTTHAPWIDNIPWPGVRDMLIDNPEKYTFAEFSELYSHNVTINWPYATADILVDLGDTSGTRDSTATQAIVNPMFERHIRKLENWTVRKEFDEYYPEMRDAVYTRN